MTEDFLALAIGSGATPSNLCLTDLETVIERGQVTFIEVGRALMEIRDRRLYKETHATFEAYCGERWGWGRDYANKTIRAAKFADSLDTDVSTPKTEGEAREQMRAPTRKPSEPIRRPKRETPSEHVQVIELARRQLTDLREQYAIVTYWQPVWDAIDELNKGIK